MPQVTVYIRDDDLDKWKGMEKKSEFIHNALNPEVKFIKGWSVDGKDSIPRVDKYSSKTIKTPTSPVLMSTANNQRSALKLCEHGADPKLCKHAKNGKPCK